MNPEYWGQQLLLITYGIRGVGQFGLLSEYATQEQFFEFVEDQQRDNSREVNMLEIQRLSEESFEILRPRYERVGRVLKGE